MSRAPYNTTADIWFGPSSILGPPNTRYRIGVPCRVVPQTEIVAGSFPESVTNRWLTYPSPQMHMFSGTIAQDAAYVFDYSYSDRVSIPSGSAAAWVALRAEAISPAHTGAYQRVLLAPLGTFALPSALLAPAGPGASCAAATPISRGVMQIRVATPPGATSWWVLPNVLSGQTYYLQTNWAVNTGAPFGIMNGSTCGTAIAAIVTFMFTGLYRVQCNASGSMWIVFAPPTAGPFSHAFSVNALS